MPTKQKIIKSITVSAIFIIIYLIMLTFFPSDTVEWPYKAVFIIVYSLSLWIFN